MEQNHGSYTARLATSHQTSLYWTPSPRVPACLPACLPAGIDSNIARLESGSYCHSDRSTHVHVDLCPRYVVHPSIAWKVCRKCAPLGADGGAWRQTKAAPPPRLSEAKSRAGQCLMSDWQRTPSRLLDGRSLASKYNPPRKGPLRQVLEPRTVHEESSLPGPLRHRVSRHRRRARGDSCQALVQEQQQQP